MKAISGIPCNFVKAKVKTLAINYMNNAENQRINNVTYLVDRRICSKFAILYNHNTYDK